LDVEQIARPTPGHPPIKSYPLASTPREPPANPLDGDAERARDLDDCLRHLDVGARPASRLAFVGLVAESDGRE
jgi:hypothetical protein